MNDTKSCHFVNIKKEIVKIIFLRVTIGNLV